MPPRKRVKGCFQCSVRRIDCDLAEPKCVKCCRKGIECSGLARIRFAPGLASRGKLKGASVPVISPEPVPARPVSKLTVVVAEEDLSRGRVSGALVSPAFEPCGTAIQAVESNCDDDARDEAPEAVSPDSEYPSSPHIATHDKQEALQPALELQSWIPPITSQARGLYCHFSQTVAPAMVVIDSVSNGYRNVILSMACNDDLLGRAVGVVAAQHLGLTQPQARDAARRGRTAVIQKLRRDAAVATNAPQLVFTPSTWATVLILLVGETVTGGEEFEQLFRMLVAAAQNCDLSTVPPVLRDFLLKQTHMFEIIARPQISSVDGIEIITRSLDSHLDWVSCDNNAYDTDKSRALAVTEQAFREASTLYLSRATSGQTASLPVVGAQATVTSVARLRTLVSSLDPAAEGAHALVWPCFVAGAESKTAEDRQFFMMRLAQIYAITKFKNVQIAHESLPLIWAMQDNATAAGDESSSWVTRLGQLSKTLIM